MFVTSLSAMDHWLGVANDASYYYYWSMLLCLVYLTGFLNYCLHLWTDASYFTFIGDVADYWDQVIHFLQKMIAGLSACGWSVTGGLKLSRMTLLWYREIYSNSGLLANWVDHEH